MVGSSSSSFDRILMHFAQSHTWQQRRGWGEAGHGTGNSSRSEWVWLSKPATD